MSSEDIKLVDFDGPKIPLEIRPEFDVYYKHLGKTYEKTLNKITKDTDINKIYDICKKEFPHFTEKELFDFSFKIGYRSGRLQTVKDSGKDPDDYGL